MKKIFISLVLIGLAAVVQATERTRSAKLSAAVAVIQHPASAKGTWGTDDGIQELHAEKMLSVFGYAGGGFAIIANDDAFPAVIGYSDSKFDLQGNGGLAWFVRTAAKSMAAMIAEGNARKAPVIPQGNFKQTVAPLLKSTWNQDAPYNSQCPTTASGAAYPTGCVATALSQIMYYHRYPVHGKGSHQYSFTPTTGDGRILSADFGAATYDWDNMLDNYVRGNYTQTQATAVSTLMLHCGVAVDMQYTPNGSGAYSSEARTGMINYFTYNENIDLLNRAFYSVSEWMKLIYTELNNDRPIYYAGADATQGGHAFVLDGYDANGLIHVNWGWGADGGNDYYDIALLNPIGFQFSEGQDMLIYISPEKTGEYQSHIIAEEAFDARHLTKKMVSVFTKNLYNLCGEPFSGTVAIILDGNGKKQVLKEAAVNNIANGHLINVQLAGVVTLPESLSDGDYRVYPASKTARDSDWRLVRRPEGMVNSAVLHVKNGDYTVTLDKDDAWTTITAIKHIEFVAGKKNQKIYTVDGRFAGYDMNSLPQGIYIVNGKKVSK